MSCLHDTLVCYFMNMSVITLCVKLNNFLPYKCNELLIVEHSCWALICVGVQMEAIGHVILLDCRKTTL